MPSAIGSGKSLAMEKQREKRRLTEDRTFGEFTVKWLAGAKITETTPETTRSMRKSIVDRDITPIFKNRLVGEISADDLRTLCQTVKAQGASATAVHVCDIVRQIYVFAILRGEKVANPADDVGAAYSATFGIRPRCSRSRCRYLRCGRLFDGPPLALTPIW